MQIISQQALRLSALLFSPPLVLPLSPPWFLQEQALLSILLIEQDFMRVLGPIQAKVMVTVAALVALVLQLAMVAKYLEELGFVLLMPIPFERCSTLEPLHICELYWNESALGFSILAF